MAEPEEGILTSVGGMSVNYSSTRESGGEVAAVVRVNIDSSGVVSADAEFVRTGDVQSQVPVFAIAVNASALLASSARFHHC